MIHLDTSFVILALRAGTPEEGKIRDWVASGESLTMSAVDWAEFLCGLLSRSELDLAARIVGQCRDLTAGRAEVAVCLFNETDRRRGSLSDWMIAAAALSDDAPVATTNVGDFRRFGNSGLQLA